MDAVGVTLLKGERGVGTKWVIMGKLAVKN